MDKKQAQAYIDSHKSELWEVSDKVWYAAELAFNEKKSVRAEVEYLKSQGFEVEEGLGGVETAFCGRFGKGKPVIGFLGEFDALGGLSPVPDEFQLLPRDQQQTGHGCGHNLLGVSSIGAAMIMKNYLEQTGKEGTIIYFGCPGEEGGSGKAFMAREGVFDELDCAITWHPGGANGVMTGGSMANIQVKYIFKGISSHAAGAPEMGRSALDGLELMNMGVQFLREHMGTNCRVHYSIVDTGGLSPNVVQSHAAAIYLIRSNNNKNAAELKRRVDLIADGAALMTETTVEKDFMKACTNYRGNNVLNKLMQANLEELPLPGVDEKDMEFVKKINKTCPKQEYEVRQDILDVIPEEEQAAFIKKCQENDIFDFIMPLTPYKDGAGSTDVGDVSAVCPTTQCNVATWASKTPGHSWQIIAQGVSDYARDRMVYCSKVMAGVAIDLFENPAIIDEAKKEHKKNYPDGYQCPIPKGVKPRPLG
ncbi:MAG: amidohydrolase [Firmicutes bacterium]|nr:amidohydrolase [Bacillota bacterium]